MTIILNGTSGITTPDLTSDEVNGIPLLPGVTDPENRIINGAFDFWQRGTSSTAAGYVAADRWSNSVTGGTVTQSRQAFALGDTLGSNNPTYFLRQTISGQSLASHNALTVQNIEDVRSYAGQTITILGWARRSSGSGNMAVELVQSFGSGGSPSSAVEVTPQTVTLTTSFAPFALTYTVPSIAGKTIGTNNNSALVLLFWTSAGSNFNDRTNSLGLQTIGVDLWGIHIKVGTHTTEAVNLYHQPELGTELVRCERYYQVVFRDGWLRTYVSNVYRSPFPFRTAMRGIPTLSSTINGTSIGLGSNDTDATSTSSGRISVQFTAGGAGVIDISSWLLAADAEI